MKGVNPRAALQKNYTREENAENPIATKNTNQAGEEVHITTASERKELSLRRTDTWSIFGVVSKLSKLPVVTFVQKCNNFILPYSLNILS